MEDGSATVLLLALGLVLGVVTIRARYQQQLEGRQDATVVTPDFLKFQGNFISEQHSPYKSFVLKAARCVLLTVYGIESLRRGVMHIRT